MKIEAELLEFMYKNSTNANIDVLPFLIEKFPGIEQSAQAGMLIDNLKEAGLIKPLNDKYILWGKGSPKDYTSEDEWRRTLKWYRDQDIMFTGGTNRPFFAILTFEGRKEVNRLRDNKKLEDERESVITTNTVSRVSAIVSAGIAILVLIIQINSCQKEKVRDSREARKLNQDSLQNQQQAKADSTVIEKISLILQGLSDSVKQK